MMENSSVDRCCKNILWPSNISNLLISCPTVAQSRSNYITSSRIRMNFSRTYSVFGQEPLSDNVSMS